MRFVVFAGLLLFAVLRAVHAQEPPASATEVSYFSYFEGWATDPSALDATERFLEPKKKVTCDATTLVPYHSKALRYGVLAHPEFVERLRRFETLVIEHATAHYGRAPRRLLHKGAYSCRSQHARKERISEHALGNAIDVIGFELGPLPRGAAAPAEMPRHMRRAVSLRVGLHWSPRSERDAYHARFLHTLTESLRDRPDIFRGIVGPPRPRHHDHLHFDAAPWRYSMFGYDRS